MKNYGFPYKGSKNRLAEKVVKLFPDAEKLLRLVLRRMCNNTQSVDRKQVEKLCH